MTSPLHRRRPALHALAVVAAAAAAVLAVALPASAHVHVTSPDAAPGAEDGTLVFRVPSESATARTTAVSVQLPTSTPFAFVSAKPVAGWRITTTEKKLAKPVSTDGFTLTKATSTVTWTAEAGQGLASGEFQEFELSVGPFAKDASTLAFPATQTYSDGSVVKWDQPTPAGGEEPDHPVPTLDLTAAAPASVASSGHAHAATATPHESDRTARWLGGAGLALGVAALAVALLTGRRRPVERTA